MKIRPYVLKPQQNGFDWELLKRHGDVVMLRKTLPYSPDWENLEVAIIKVQPVHPKDEKSKAAGYTHVEALPPSESWGTYGWSYRDRDKAEVKYRELCEARSEPGSKFEWDNNPEPTFDTTPEPTFEDNPEPTL